MPKLAFTKPVQDSVAKVNQEVAVGEDLDFQRSWWRFERVAWSIFVLLIILDLTGLFGRGPLSHSTLHNSAFTTKYERIERSDTPTLMDVSFAPGAIHDGKVQLYVSESLIDALGTQRVIPQPALTTIGNTGLTYTWDASSAPASVQFALQPSKPGIFHFTLQVPGSQPSQARVFVMP